MSRYTETDITAQQEIQKCNHPSTKAWQRAHETIKAAVLELFGVDIDGPASWASK